MRCRRWHTRRIEGSSHLSSSRPSDPPLLKYAKTADGFDLAYWVIGGGPPLLEVPHIQMSHLLFEWEIDAVRRWYENLSRFRTVVRYDNRGSGASAGECSDYSLDALVRDIEAVAAAVDLQTFALCGRISGALPAIAYAARHPDRVSHLILFNGFARPDHGQAPRLRSLFAIAGTDWELFTESLSQAALGWQDASAARQWAAVIRTATNWEALQALLKARSGWDASALLLRIQAPTLVLFDRRNALVTAERNRELATGIPGAQLLGVDGESGMPDAVAVRAIERFLAGRSPADVAPTFGVLTPRERDVLRLIASGRSNADVAHQLAISVNTVTRHLTHIYTKTGTANRADAVAFAFRHGLAR